MKNMFKRLLSIAIVAVMVIGMIPGTAFYGLAAEETDSVIDTEDELSAALAAGGEVTLGGNVTVTNTITIPAGITATLNLNGYTISQETACTASYSMITNKGTLTVTGNGKISFTDTSAGDPNFGWGSYTLANYGTLVVENGTIENLSKQNTPGNVVHMYCAIQQGSGAVSTTINGGKISTPTYRSVRTNAGALIINGGEFEGQVWVQPNQGDCTIEVNGGSFAPTAVDGSSIFLTNAGEGKTVTSAAITGGTFATKIGASNPTALAGAITGGTFTEAAVNGTNAALLGENMSFVSTGDGTYGVIVDGAVAKVGETYYVTLAEALAAAAAGTGNVTVEILDDVDLTGIDWTPVTVSAPGYPVVTVNGNYKTITGLNDMLFAGTWAGKSGLIINDLTIKDSCIENDVNDEKGTVGVGAFIGYPQASATITLNNCHLVDSTVSGGHWTGGLIGMAGGYNGNDGPVFMNLTISNCSVTGSTITGKGSAGGVIGHGSCAAWTNVVIKDTTVSGNTITSTGSSTNKAGSVMGTIGAAGMEATAAGQTKQGGAFVTATVSDNAVVSGGTTITTIYGRQGTASGVLTLTGGTYDSYPIEKDVAYAKLTEGYAITENTDGTYSVASDPSVGKVAKIGDTYYADLHEAMVACKAGETVELIANVDLAGTEWEPVSFKGTFDGKDYTISNLTINKPGVSSVGFITSLNGTFKNVTFTNPTVTGGENTGVVAGRAGGSAALAENITVNGTIKVETTHKGYARAGVIVGGWGYGNYKNITVDGGDKAVSYIKHTGGGDGRYVAGIVGHADDVESYVNCTVKNITISGGWLCGGITGPGPADGLISGCTVENVNIDANYSGGMFGWYFGNGTIENSTIKDVAFVGGTTNNGAIGGYGVNNDATVTNVTIENVTNQGKALLGQVAEINGTFYYSLDEAFAAAQDGDEVKILTAGTYALSTAGKNITITGTVDGVVFDNIGAKNLNGANITFNNVTFDYYPNVDYTGLQHSGELTYNNCTFNGQVFLFGQSDSFNKCTFNQDSANAYNVWTYSSKKVDFNECTFNCAGKSVLIYRETNAEAHVINVKDCAFIASAPVSGKAAIEIDTSLMTNENAVTLTIGNSTATGFDEGSVSGNTLWNDKKDCTNLSVTVDNVHVWPVPALPTATVSKADNDALTFATNFKADEVTDAQLAYYGDWYADFVLTFPSDVTLNANGGADGYLSGQYDSWSENWVNVPFENVSLKAGESLKVMEYAAKLMGKPGLKLTYNDVYTAVKDFDCGVFLEDAYIKAHAGEIITLELRMYNPENEAESYLIGKSYEFMIPVALPTATVSAVVNEDLTFATNFKADEVTAAQLAYYGDWYADFVLTFPSDVTLNANGGADGYLSGQYDSWSENWVNVPFENVSLKGGEGLKVMEYAAKLMGKPGLKLTYNDVYTAVKDFDCGVFLEDSYISANAGKKILLELRMYNPENEAESYVIGETYEFIIPDVDAVYKNTTTGKTYDNSSDATMEAKAGETVILLKDHTEGNVLVSEGVDLDLNGYTLTATYASVFGNLVDNSEANSGVLVVEATKFLIQENNKQLTVKTAKGYQFVEIIGFNQTWMNETTFVFQPLFESAAHDMLNEGVAVTGVSIQVEVTWKPAEDSDDRDTRTFKYGDTLVTDFINSYKPATGKYGRMFTLALVNPDNYLDLTCNIQVASDTGVICAP